MKPNFLIIGAPKSATTSLCDLLGQHPQVFMSTPKETHASSPMTISTGEVGLGTRRSLRTPGKPSPIGEGSTSYSLTGVYPNVVPRIMEHLPDARIIYIVRNPVARVESGWMQLRHMGSPTAPRSFDRFVRMRPNAVDGSSYWRQISQYRRHIPDERILVLFFEDFKKDADGTLDKCFRFLGVDPTVTIPDLAVPRNVYSEHYQDRMLVGWVPAPSGIRPPTPADTAHGSCHAYADHAESLLKQAAVEYGDTTLVPRTD